MNPGIKISLGEMRKNFFNNLFPVRGFGDTKAAGGNIKICNAIRIVLIKQARM